MKNAKQRILLRTFQVELLMCSELDIGNEAIWMKSIQNWNWNENTVIVVTKVRTMERKEKQCNEHGYY